MNVLWDTATESRADVSRFMVHLTRDDSDQNGAPARDNFLQILAGEEILALRPHGLYASKIPSRYTHKFDVCCFTECPLSQIKQMVRYMPGRRVQLEAYGFVFPRDFLLKRAAQPVTHVNSYGNDKSLRRTYDEMFEAASRSKFIGSKWKPLVFLSAMHDGYDFAWEREWRHLGSLSFKPNDLVCAVVPDGEDVEIRKKLAKLAIPMISPDWGADQLIEEFRRQQKRTKRLCEAPRSSSSKQPIRPKRN